MGTHCAVYFAGWGEMQATPPEHFWRTLVADRGSDGKNPPVYYSRACQESFRKGNTTSGVVDTTGLIEHERNSVVAQFCRRVQAAIWNRALVKTQAGRLGLVSANVKEFDFVCILYGCSVPVILRRHGPKETHVIKSEMKWELKFLANYVGESYKNHLSRRKLFREKREKDKEIYKIWENRKREQWKNDTIWTEQWKLVRAGLMRIHEFRAWVLKKRVMELENANDNNDAKMAIESMRNYVHVMLSQIYEISAWALQDEGSDKNIMDRLRHSNDAGFRESFKMTDHQKELWDAFCCDTIWGTRWKQMNEDYYEYEGFRMWAHVHKKPIVYPEDWDKTHEEWKKAPGQHWTREWATGNSWILCIDSFRAWLRDRGKFYGPEEVLNNKQRWEADSEWHNTRRNKNESEVESFNFWMNKKGLENPDLQESSLKEQRMKFEEWRKDWLSDHPEATWSDTRAAEQSEWTKIEEKLEKQKSEEDDKRKQKAQKRDKEPFLERWRKDWKPEVVNWEEFEIALSYGRHWLKLVKRRKRDYVKQQEQEWSELDAIQNRQLGRAENLKKKGNRLISHSNWETETIVSNRADTGVTSTHILSNCPSPSTGTINDNTQTNTDELEETLSNLGSQTLGASVLANHAGNDPNQRNDPTVQLVLENFNTESSSTGYDKDNQEASHMISMAPLERSQTEVVQRITLELHAELENESAHTFSSRKILHGWVQRKKQIPSLWENTQKNIERDLARWKRGTPRVIGKDGMFHLDFRPPSKGETMLREIMNRERKDAIGHGEDTEETDDEADKGKLEEMTEEKVAGENKEMTRETEKKKVQKKNYTGIKRRQRLTKKEKAEYERIIEANFLAKMGDDGKWYYEMMGECYVHGMMDGEAMTHQNNEGISARVFEIR